MTGKSTIRVALDWTPNTIHTGLFVAVNKGYYAENGLDVKLLPPDAEYSTTPARQVENGTADIAICPSESCIAYQETGKMQLEAVYTILQKDASAIVSVDPRFSTLSSLARGTYGSYNAKYEDHIVKEMVTADGGDGDSMKIQGSTSKLSLFDEVKDGKIDATWVFLPWEGIDAEMQGIKLHAFVAEKSGVPYGYSPVLARDKNSPSPSSDALKSFVQATQRGYQYALDNAVEACRLLRPHCSPPRSDEFLEKSQLAINGYYGSSGSLGEMDSLHWHRWVEWLKERKLLHGEHMEAVNLYTNRFFG